MFPKLLVVCHCLYMFLSHGSAQAQFHANRPWKLPTGMTPNTSAVKLPNVYGYAVFGQGAGRLPKNPKMLGTTSYLVRRGNDDSAMLIIEGSNFHVHDLSFQGVMIGDGKTTRPDAGIWLRFAPGTGTGNMVAERLTFENLRCAWKIGNNDVGHMCDTSVLRDSNVSNCDFVVEQNNLQAIQNRIEGVQANHVKCFFRAHGGGNSAIRDSAVTQVADDVICPVLWLGSSNKIGSNSWTYTIDNFKADRQCGDRLELLRMDGPKYASINLSGVHIAHDGYGDGKYIWNLQDGATIDIRGGENTLQRHSIFVTDHPMYPPPTIVAQNVGQCCEPKDMVAPGSGPVRLIIRECFTWDRGLNQSVPIKNFSHVVSGEKE